MNYGPEEFCSHQPLLVGLASAYQLLRMAIYRGQEGGGGAIPLILADPQAHFSQSRERALLRAGTI